MINLWIVAASLLLAAQPLLAQNKKVYRCDAANGRVTYSDEACKGGAELKDDDARSDEQRKTAADVAARDQRLADKLTRERRAAEKAAPAPAAGHITHSAAEKAAKEQPSSKKTTTKKKRVKEKTQA